MSSEPRPFETSAAYVGAVVRALQKLGRLEGVKAKATPAVAQMFASPNARSWWSAADSFAMTEAIVAEGGVELVQRAGQLAVLESLAPILRPLVGVLLALSGPSPATLLSRFGQLSGAAVKNVHFEWTSTGPSSGELTISYTVTVPPAYVAWWLGGFDFVWETTKKKGTTKATHHGTRLHFALAWA